LVDSGCLQRLFGAAIVTLIATVLTVSLLG